MSETNPILEELRTVAITQKQNLISKVISIRERELRELLFLQGGGNLLDYKEGDSSLNQQLEQYHEKHSIARPNTGTSSDALDNSTNAISSLLATNTDRNANIMEKATKDAEILKRVSELQREGLWSTKRLPKLPEPPRTKVHWDYLLAEMTWLANDFKEERKWKQVLARKVSKQIKKRHDIEKNKEERIVKDEEKNLRKIAKFMALEVKKFWTQIDKLCQYKEQLILEAQKKKELGNQLDQLVEQTEKYSKMLAKDLQSTSSNDIITEPVTLKSLLGSSTVAEDIEEYEPMALETSDDETTISVAEEHKTEQDKLNELSLLKQESDIPVDVLLKKYKSIEQSDSENENEDEEDSEIEIEDYDEEELEESYEEEEEEEEAEESGSSMLSSDSRDGSEVISKAAEIAKSAQPTGYTLSTTTVKTKVPFLLRGTLREYQHIGLDWLVTMYDKKLNGILADEMGLGKTIMTISLLAHLACEKEIWGPHLIIVPTSTMLNWEVEFKRWCPSLKILTYYGSLKERKLKRQGWSKPNAFHVCITSYKLVLQDHSVFRRKKWKYMILDEAQHIKNFKSQRWQILLNFNSSRRLLLTGTPLQNSLMELWSLMHFLMPSIFQSHKEFKDWFSNPVHNMIEGEEQVNEDLINRLHSVLRPFILRRLKSEVEKQLPPKIEHIVTCKLSKRQRHLYEEFMRNSMTQDALSSGNFLGIVNILMQLRKVTNHPDLFEVRPIISPFDQDPIVYYAPSLAVNALDKSPFDLDLSLLNLVFTMNDMYLSSWQHQRSIQLISNQIQLESLISPPSNITSPSNLLSDYLHKRQLYLYQEELTKMKHKYYLSKLRGESDCIYGYNLLSYLYNNIIIPSIHIYSKLTNNSSRYLEYSNTLRDLILLPEQRAHSMKDIISNFVCIIPSARASPIQLHCSHPNPSKITGEEWSSKYIISSVSSSTDIYRPSFVRSQLYFPDKRLIQYDCGKLQALAELLYNLKSGGHRALIFTQMTRMLDVLEIFLNIYGYTYLRLDGATKVEKRQMLMERFNKDKKIFLFILSTRSGGVGINLTGADTVIFYDSDWNPAMDAQAQDRCHRIGQTREVHIYRLITKHTIEENILKKATQKRHLDDIVISGGSFTTDFFKKVDLRELIQGEEYVPQPKRLSEFKSQMTEQDWVRAVSQVEEDTDVQAMKIAQKELRVENRDFDTEFKEDKNINNEEKESFTPPPNPKSTSSVVAATQDQQQQASEEAESEEQFEFMSEMSGIQRYAFRFLSSLSEPRSTLLDTTTTTTITTPSSNTNTDFVTTTTTTLAESLHKKEPKEEEEEDEQEDENEEEEEEETLFYEIPAGVSIETIKEEVYPQLSVYQPPSPEIEEFYMPSFDDLDYLSIFPQYVSILSASNKLASDKKENKKLSKEFSTISEDFLVGGDFAFESYAHLQDNIENEHNLEEDENEEEEEEDLDSIIIEGRKRKQQQQNASNKKKKNSRTTVSINSTKKEDLFLEYVLPWSRQEDMLLIEAKHRFFNNMEVVMDTIDMIPSVVTKHRSKKQCIERTKQLSTFSTNIESINNIWTLNVSSSSSRNNSSNSDVNVSSIGILDAIKRTLQKNKQIPGKLGTAAQSEGTVSPHISHTQVAMSVGVSKNIMKNPIEICNNILLKLQKSTTTTITPVNSTVTSTASNTSTTTTTAPKLPSNSNMDTKLGTTLSGNNNNTARTTIKPAVPVTVGGTNKVLPNVVPINTTGIVIGNANAPGGTTSVILNSSGTGQTSARLAHINQVVSQPNNLIVPSNANNRGVMPITIAPPVKSSVGTNNNTVSKPSKS